MPQPSLPTLPGTGLVNLDMTALAGALKEMYSGQVVENLVYEDNPLFAMVPKDEKFYGKWFPQPIITGASQGRSANFIQAQTNQSPAQIQEFLLTRVSDYSIATITNEAMEASESDAGSFLAGVKTLVDGAFRSITLSMASGLFRSGTGSFGSISTITTGVIVLVNPTDVVQFEINMVLQAAATDGAAPRAAFGYVIAVDRSVGTVTVSASAGGAAGTPTSWTAADFLLQAGDSNAKMSGLAAWLPPTAPTSTPFFGVNRAVDPVRLGGVRYNGATQSIEEALINASNFVAREGGKPTHIFTNFASYSALELALGSKIQYIDVKGPAGIGFRGIQLNGANTVMQVFPDRSCQPFQAWMLQLNTWKFRSLKGAPRILTYKDTNQMLRVYNADSMECRVGGYVQLGCSAPGWNANVSLGA